MLLVPTYLDRSPLHGIGVFAVRVVPSGTAVWRFTPGFDLELDPAVLAREPDHFRERLLHYGYIDPRLGRYILCCDDARFLNHSDHPNLAPDFTLDRHGVDIAIRDIAASEELTLDYGLLEGKTPGA